MSLSKSNTPTIINECETNRIRREFVLPEQKTLFKIAKNPFNSNTKVAEWVDQVFKISLIDTEKYKMIKCATLFPAYFYPFCTDIKRYEALVKMYQLFFVFDDHSECEWGDVGRDSLQSTQIWGQMEAGLKAILANNLFLSTDGWKSYAKLIFAIHQQIGSTYNEVQKKRFVDVWLKYIDKNKEENDKIASKYIFKHIDEILEIRMHSVAARPVFQLTEFANNISVTEEEWESMDELMDRASIAIIICNDIFSFEKEYSEQNRHLNRMYNVVAITALSKRIPIEKAMEEMTELSKHYEQKTMDLMKQLQCGGISKNMSIFLDGVNHIIGGHYYVSTVVDRYNKPID